MLCESLRPVIRQFLDDLLDEKDYQEVHSHLENCARCHTFASSVATLSYQLYELGQVTVPPDIPSIVSYQFTQKVPLVEAGPAAPPPAVSGSGSLWKILVVVAIVILGVWAFFFRPQTALERSPAVFVPDLAATNLPKDSSDLLSHWSSVNRHFHLSKSSQPELVGLLSQLGVVVEHESSSLIVFNVPQGKWGGFESGFEGFSGVIKEFGEIQMPQADDTFIQVSVFLE